MNFINLPLQQIIIVIAIAVITTGTITSEMEKSIDQLINRDEIELYQSIIIFFIIVKFTFLLVK